MRINPFNYHFQNKTGIDKNTYGSSGIQTANNIARALAKCGHAAQSWNGRTIIVGNTSQISHFQLQPFLKTIPGCIWTPVICGRDSLNNLMIKLEKPTKYQAHYTQTINRIAHAVAKYGCALRSGNGHTITIENSSRVSHFSLQALLKQIPCLKLTPVICGRDSHNNLMIKLEKPTKCEPINKIEKTEKTQKIKPETKQVITKVTQKLMERAKDKMELIPFH